MIRVACGTDGEDRRVCGTDAPCGPIAECTACAAPCGTIAGCSHEVFLVGTLRCLEGMGTHERDMISCHVHVCRLCSTTCTQ